MRIQPVTQQPNFKGRVVFERGTTAELTKFMPDSLLQKIKTVASIIQEKPYDMYISRNKQNSNFYNVAANKSFKEAEKIKEYTVKVRSDIFAESILDAAKEAMEMYEKYISKGIKG